MNVRSIWQHSGLILISSLSLSLAIGCGDEPAQDGGVVDSGPVLDGGPDAGPDAGCKGVGKGCFDDAECCPSFHCDQNTNRCAVNGTDGGPDGGLCSHLGESCQTYADCCAGLALACNTPADGGAAGSLVCGPNTTQPTAICVTNGNACGDGGACCSGNCISGTCIAWPTCGTEIPNGSCGGPASCGSDLECCNNNYCDGGSCAQTCGVSLDNCTVTPDSCCTGAGFNCIPVNYGGTIGILHQCAAILVDSQGNVTNPCGPPGSPTECDVGTQCNGAAAVDPCALAGLVCKATPFTIGGATLTTCQLPTQFNTCVVGGPTCQPIPNSSATNLQCLSLQGNDLCMQPCVTPADCVDPLNGCQQAGDGKACLTDFGPNLNPSCSKAYTTCDSAATADGICLEFNTGGGTQSLICLQEATDGGGVGACCNVNGTRQAGGLCAYPNICFSGLCTQVCDPNPPAGADAGFPCDQSVVPQYCFFPGIATSGDTTGTCTPYCDALALGDAGSCPAAAPGNPSQFCQPAYVLDQRFDVSISDTAVGVCTAAPTDTVLDTGALCNIPNTTCREGTQCLQTTATGDAICRHLCGPVHSFPDGGDNGCVSGQTCFPIYFGTTGTPSTQIGFCDTVCDGGPC